jgi:hypothetical protein
VPRSSPTPRRSDWLVLDEDVVVRGPDEEDPDDARDARADYLYDRDR